MASPTPIPWSILVRLVYAILTRRKLSFRHEAIQAVAGYLPNLMVYGQEHIPKGGGFVAAINHYTQAGFRSWWLTLSVSSALPVEVHWVTAAAWREPRWLTPATYWAFTRMAQVYGFTSMPPMPPQPSETAGRAAAVREVIEYVRTSSQPVVGLAPEGGDEEQGRLRRPYPGAGRFMLHLAKLGLPFLPVGIYGQEDHLCLRFGPAFELKISPDLPNGERDICAADIVMTAIARQLPVSLRGVYSV